MAKPLEAPLCIVFVTAAAGAGTRAAPYGAATVASALSARADFAGKISISIMESLPGDPPEDIAARVLNLKPQLVGFSVYSWNRASLGSIARALRPRLATALFVAGGPETSADPEGVMAEGLADIAVAGEGEAAMAGIVAAVLGRPAGAGLRGIIDSGTIIRSAMLDPVSLGSPWLDGTLNPATWGGATMELARGCPFRCAFCFESKGAAIGTKGAAIGTKGDAKVRHFPLARVATELDRFRSAGVQEVFVLDPTFNADGKRMAEAVRLMAEKGTGLRFILELRAELLDRNQARLLAGLDCSVQIGLQSSDPAVLAGVDRSFDPAIFARKVRLLEEYGVVYGLDLIYGLPGDDPAGFSRSLDYALALVPNHLDVFRLAVLPGTALAERAEGHALEYDRLAPHLVHSTPTFPAVALDRADRIASAMDLLYNRGRAVVWFPAISKALGMKPSAIIEAFADSAQAQGLATGSGLDVVARSAADSGTATVPVPSHRDIETASLSFINDLFRDRARPGATTSGMAKAGIDLIRASGAWTRALAEGETTELALDWSPDELMDYAAADLRRFVSEFDKNPGRWACAPGRDGPHFTRLKTRRH
ncbi:MAG: B12-binding domain-containing radical SAM protein [Spirochaetota bacterium]